MRSIYIPFFRILLLLILFNKKNLTQKYHIYNEETLEIHNCHGSVRTVFNDII